MPTPRTSSSSRYALLAALAACGRVGFDQRPADAAPDAPAAPCLASDLGPRRDFVVGAAPTSAAAGDLDGDGKPDLVVQHGKSVGVLRGHGDGTFDAVVDYAAADGACGFSSEAVALADLDGDGFLDVATSDCTNVNSSTDGGAIVLLGNDDGTLRPWTRYPTGNAANGIAVTDLDGDGKVDIVATDYYGSTVVSVLLGNGDGTFRTHVDYNVDSFPSYVAIRDLDGDGKPDLAVANESALGVSVLIGNGDGTFKPEVEYSTGTSPESLAVADVDRDGHLDLVVANSADADTNAISILRGNGDGTFQTPTALTDLYPWSVTARVNAPIDLLVANYVSPGSITVFHGNGDGTFAPGADIAVDNSPTSVLTTDLDGDGVEDVVVTNNGANMPGNTISVLLATCTAR